MKGWRTLAINLAIALFGVLETADWTGLLGGGAAGITVTGIGIANMILRSITTSPVGRRG
jgi:hypothetical protein